IRPTQSQRISSNRPPRRSRGNHPPPRRTDAGAAVNMLIRRRAWLTREGWYYLAILVFIIGGAVLRSVNLLVILAGMLIAPLLFNWRLVMASLMGLVVRRRLPEHVLAGEPLTVEIHVTNTRAWMSTWLLRVEDRITEIQRATYKVQASRT